MRSLKASVPASSSRERQYSRPPALCCPVPSSPAGSIRLLIGSLLAMTCRTTRQFLNAILFDQLLTQGELIDRRLVFHAKDVLARPHESFRRAMTVQTPIHIKRILAPHERHLVDSPVTGHTADSLVHVNAMVEINETGQIVHARPLNRLSGTKALAYRFQNWTVGPDLGMAVHAGFSRRNTGERALLDRCVAITAIDSIVADVMFVAEGHRLAARHSHFGDVRRLIDGGQSSDHGQQENQTAENRYPGNRVGAWVKNLRHRLLHRCPHRHHNTTSTGTSLVALPARLRGDGRAGLRSPSE